MRFLLPDGSAWQEFTIHSAENGKTIVEIVPKEDVTPVIEDNKKAQTGPKQTLGKGTQTSMYKLGQLSALKAHQLMKQGIYQDDAALRRWFNDLDNYLWRTVHKKRRWGDDAVQGSQTDR